MDGLEHITTSFNAIFDEFKVKVKEMKAAEPFWNTIMNFVHSVDWGERWIQAILAMHLMLAFLAFSCRRRLTVQLIIFAWGTCVVYFSENLNALGGEFWEDFATQPYFDRNGVFFTAIVTGPLLLIMLFVLVNYLLHVVDLMVKMKRKELQAKSRQKAKAAAQKSGTEKDS